MTFKKRKELFRCCEHLLKMWEEIITTSGIGMFIVFVSHVTHKKTSLSNTRTPHKNHFNHKNNHNFKRERERAQERWFSLIK